MSNEEQEDKAAVSEQAVVDQQDTHEEESKMVPLAALQAERRKRQEFEARTKVYEDLLAKKNASTEEEEEEDPEALLTKSSFREEKALTKREILEQVYQDMNPEAVQKINMYLKPILDKKPWLAATVDNAVNRLARANEIVDDYMHLVEEKPKAKAAVADARRIVENSQKPRSPVEVGKSAQPSGTEYLKSIQGKKEFREYRQKVLRGEA
jgi:NADH dehydrogenase/NADH:ubiquinone oxidoreductase subunit G